MYRIFTLLITLFSFQIVSAQLVINELDCDTPGVDDKEFVEIKSDTPNFALDGYVVVFFNGSESGGNSSYLAFDLDGQETDINGLLLIGSNTVSPVPQYIVAPNLIQNGADAIAIYQADDLDFEEVTVAYVDETLIDVLIYGTSDPVATGLIDIFDDFDPSIMQIDEGPGNNTNSIQRNNDGTYFVGVPTPRQLNDGSGVILNGILIEVPQIMYDEGDSFTITFTAEQPVTSDLNFTINLNNGTFDTNDFTGNTSLTILNGTTTTSTTITITNDDLDEGDEEIIIRLTGLPPTFVSLNNNLRIRAVDDDFTVADFGIPLNPTFGIVASTQPDGYYDSLDGLAGTVLRQAIQDIIAEEGVVRAQTYADCVEILRQADQNPANSNQVWLVYTEQGRAKLDYQTSSNSVGKWNREHTYPRSQGGFFSIEEDDIADGIDVFWNTTADSLRHANSDAHAIRAVDGPENSTRGNQHYGQYSGPVGNQGSFKGDVARSVLFIALRYNGLEVVNGFPDVVGEFGDLATILDWHRNDPPDDYEMNRNNIVYDWQFNRNPLIDYPDLVEYIWGENVGEVWNQPLSTIDNTLIGIKIFPNPTTDVLYVNGISQATKIEILSVEGRLLNTFQLENNGRIDLNLNSGLYVLRINSDNKTTIKKLLVR